MFSNTCAFHHWKIEIPHDEIYVLLRQFVRKSIKRLNEMYFTCILFIHSLCFQCTYCCTVRNFSQELNTVILIYSFIGDSFLHLLNSLNHKFGGIPIIMANFKVHNFIAVFNDYPYLKYNTFNTINFTHNIMDFRYIIHLSLCRK